MEPGEQDGFSWKWISLETPWVDPSGEAKAQFPMPLMCVDTPMGGVANLVCASALWHLLPSKTTVGDFFKSTGNDEFWSFATALGASQEQHLLPPKRSLTMKEKKEGWEPPPLAAWPGDSWWGSISCRLCSCCAPWVGLLATLTKPKDSK